MSDISWSVDVRHTDVPLPFTDEHRHFVTRARCYDCGEVGWCLCTLMTPTPLLEPCMVAICGRCLGELGLLLSHKPLQWQRTSGEESQTVPILHTAKEQ